MSDVKGTKKRLDLKVYFAMAKHPFGIAMGPDGREVFLDLESMVNVDGTKAENQILYPGAVVWAVVIESAAEAIDKKGKQQRDEALKWAVTHNPVIEVKSIDRAVFVGWAKDSKKPYGFATLTDTKGKKIATVLCPSIAQVHVSATGFIVDSRPLPEIQRGDTVALISQETPKGKKAVMWAFVNRPLPTK